MYTLNTAHNNSTQTTGAVTWQIAANAIGAGNGTNPLQKLQGTITVTLPANAQLNSVTINKGNSWGQSARVLFKVGSTTLNTFSTNGTYTLKSTDNKTNLTYSFQYSGSGNAWVSSIQVSYVIVASTPASVTLYDADGSSSVSNKNVGESYALPTTAAECTGKTFVGWSTSEIVTATNSKPAFKAKGESVTLVATNTFYALYATVTSNSSSVEAFSKYSGTLSTGDYVFVYNDYVMGNTISSSRCTNGTTPTITNNTISSPAAAIVWTIGTTTSNNTTYYTLYNANVSKYLAKTSNNNQASLVNSVDDTGAMYSCSSNANSTTYDFVNAGNSRYLRNNGSNGWAMYSTSTGGALTLYKKGTIETTIYDTTQYTTSCCTPLGPIKGSFFWTHFWGHLGNISSC